MTTCAPPTRVPTAPTWSRRYTPGFIFVIEMRALPYGNESVLTPTFFAEYFF